MFFENYTNYYYLIIALQAICVIHCVKKNNQQKWIWLIIFLPFIGSIIYLFSEVFTQKTIQQAQSGAGIMLYPSGRIKKLEAQLKFADTFNNRIMLADAYLAGGQTQKAIALYEGSLTGAFTENEHVLSQLILAYHQIEDYTELIRTAQKIYKLPQFARSRNHMLYAMALEQNGDEAAAEKEFKMMGGRFSNFEARYQYGMFLGRNNRQNEARQLFEVLAEEGDHLTPMEKKANRQWISSSRDMLRKMN